MQSFRTLKGFVEGTEPDEPAYFSYSATLRIFAADTLDFEAIARTLGVEPTSTHRKGDRRGPRSPPSEYDMWMLSPQVPEESSLSEHIDALWALIGKHAEYRRELKRVARVDVFLGYRSNIDHAGVEVSYSSLEMFTQLETPFSLSIIVV